MQLRTTLVLIAVLLLGLPAAARASSDDVIRDCAFDGKLDKTYSQKELQQAYKNLPSDANEYTDCSAVIRAAMTGGSGNTGPGPANGIITASGAVAGSQDDVNALTHLIDKGTKGKRPAVTLAGQKVLAGNAGLGGVLGGLAGSNGMPTSLVLAIVALGLLAVVTAYLGAREKFPHARRVALRLFGR
ncbi:MAG: hypothetical protein ACJ77Z_09290 [Thermoleophilaceae bacterium]